MLRAALFAFRGVLVDDEPIHRALFQQVLAEEGIALAPGAVAGPPPGPDDRAAFAAALAAAGEIASLPRLMRLIARKASYYQERVRREGYPFAPGAAALVRDLAAAGWMLGVVTGCPREEADGALLQEGLLAAFKVLVAAEDVREGKPSPEGYDRALESFNSLPPLPERLFHPHEVLAVEGSAEGLAAAAEAGLPTLGVELSGAPGRLARADRTVRSLAGLTPERLARLYAEISLS